MDQSDKEFEEFLENMDGDNPFFIMCAIKEKFKSVCDAYKTTLKGYNNVQRGPIKEEIESLLPDLTNSIRSCIDQFDILLGHQFNNMVDSFDDEENDLSDLED